MMPKPDDIAGQDFRERTATVALSALLFVSVFSGFEVWDSTDLSSSLLFLAGAVSLSVSLIYIKRNSLASILSSASILVIWFALIVASAERDLGVYHFSLIVSFAAYFLLPLKRANWINTIAWATILFYVYPKGQQVTIGIVISAVILIIFANLIISRLENLAVELAESHVKDKVTGCSNRDALYKEMEKSWELHKRYGVHTSALTLKIDQFDHYRDKYGRKKSDLLLNEVVQVWTSRLRNTDLLCRYGDDQFVCLLPNTKLENASSLAEDLCKASSEYEFSVGVKMHLNSIVSEIADEEHWESWLKTALEF